MVEAASGSTWLGEAGAACHRRIGATGSPAASADAAGLYGGVAASFPRLEGASRLRLGTTGSAAPAWLRFSKVGAMPGSARLGEADAACRWIGAAGSTGAFADATSLGGGVATAALGARVAASFDGAPVCSGSRLRTAESPGGTDASVRRGMGAAGWPWDAAVAAGPDAAVAGIDASRLGASFVSMGLGAAACRWIGPTRFGGDTGASGAGARDGASDGASVASIRGVVDTGASRDCVMGAMPPVGAPSVGASPPAAGATGGEAGSTCRSICADGATRDGATPCSDDASDVPDCAGARPPSTSATALGTGAAVVGAARDMVGVSAAKSGAPVAAAAKAEAPLADGASRRWRISVGGGATSSSGGNGSSSAAANARTAGAAGRSSPAGGSPKPAASHPPPAPAGGSTGRTSPDPPSASRASAVRNSAAMGWLPGSSPGAPGSWPGSRSRPSRSGAPAR